MAGGRLRGKQGGGEGGRWVMGESRENGVARGGDSERVSATTIKHIDMNEVKYSHLPFDR